MVNIAKKYGTTLKIVSAINRGTSYIDKSRFYPLRTRKVDLIDELNYNDLIDDLINSDIS